MQKTIIQYTRTIGASAVFGGLSLALAAFTAPYLPRMPGWGIAFIDPVSIIWITAYLIFGLTTGVVTSLIGTLGLLFFDPFTPIGPAMKFLATIPIILAFDFGLRLYKKTPYSGESLKSLKRYVPLSLIGTAIRIVIMTFFNILLFLYIFDLSYAKINLFGLGLSSWDAVIIVAILINAEQSLWDCLIPYLISFSSKVYNIFRFW